MNKDDLYTMMENERAFEARAILNKVISMKEPLLRQVSCGNRLSDKEIGFLLALESVDEFISQRLDDED